MKRAELHPAAEIEVREAKDYYDAQREGLGDRFLAEFERAVEQAQALRESLAAIDDMGTRKLKFRRFPYTLYFRDEPNRLWILAVGHQRRRPGYWKPRSDG